MSLVYVIMFKFTTRPCETISNKMNLVTMGPSYVGIDKAITHQRDSG
jgi:hypothetical protein